MTVLENYDTYNMNLDTIQDFLCDLGKKPHMYSTYLHWKLSFFHYIMSLSDLQKLLRELTEISQNFRKQNYLMLINKSYYIQ